MNHPSRYLLASLLATTVLVTGCTEHATKPSAQTPAGPAAATTTTTPDHAAASAAPSASSASSASSAAGTAQPAETGIPACDDYLASYKGCHRAAGIYSPDTIDQHYQAMRDTLLSQSRDPAQRSALAARCVSLAKLLKKALHGKPCEPAPPASASSAR